MIVSPEIVKSESQIAAVIHIEIPRDEIQNEMTPAIDELVSVLSQQGQSPKGPMFAHHLTQSKDRFNFEEPIDRPENVLEYVGRYTHRVAISNDRLISLKDGTVTFAYKNRETKKTQTTTLEAV